MSTDGTAPEPTLTALNMKRAQEDLKEKQVVALLDQNRIIVNSLRQNENDLAFIGYRMKESDKLKTEDSLIARLDREGYSFTPKDALKEISDANVILMSENEKLNEMLMALKKKAKKK